MTTDSGQFDRYRTDPLFLTSNNLYDGSPLTSSKSFKRLDLMTAGLGRTSATTKVGAVVKALRSHKRVKPVFEKGKRVQVFTVQPSDRVHLFHGLPFQKYTQSLVQTFEYQRIIIINEIKLLLEKSKNLKVKLNEVGNRQTADLSLFDLVDERIQQTFNTMFEETIGLIYKVAQIIEECIVTLVCESNSHPKLPDSSFVTSEAQAFMQNIRFLVKGVEYLTRAQDTYIRFTKRQRSRAHSNVIDLPTVNLLMQFMARARLNVSEVHEEYAFQETHQSQQASFHVD